jgi:hypothetical protein
VVALDMDWRIDRHRFLQMRRQRHFSGLMPLRDPTDLRDIGLDA